MGRKININLGVSFENLHVFGDSMNDTPMFLRAGKKTAMKNATDELKEIADDVTQFSCDDDGLAKYLEDHYLNFPYIPPFLFTNYNYKVLKKKKE